LCRYRTSSRNSRTPGGAIHADASRPIRNKSASSFASSWSVLALRCCIEAIPRGCANVTANPACDKASTAQYQP
jgi:hypothetical protein